MLQWVDSLGNDHVTEVNLSRLDPGIAQRRICPKCGGDAREERSHLRCVNCGIVEACCEGEVAQI
jgi:hypothetical protein